MIILRLLTALGGLALGGLIWLAFTTGDFGAAGAWLMSDPWGRVTLFDLYLGFFFLAVIIAFFEKHPLRAVLVDRALAVSGQYLGGALAGAGPAGTRPAA
jgi:hypothetical protein